jgi:dihydrofolate reductase
MLSLIVAASENNVIGRAGGLPWHLPADLKHFKATTMGKPIVMGRRTFEAIGRALPGRRSIVVTRNTALSAPGVDTATSLQGALELTDEAEEIMVTGGGELYRVALPLARRVYFTRIHATIEGDTFFPELNPRDWHEVAREERAADEKNAHALSFITLERASP